MHGKLIKGQLFYHGTESVFGLSNETHDAECECNDHSKGTLEPAEQGEKCARCKGSLVWRENGGNMCQACLNGLFK